MSTETRVPGSDPVVLTGDQVIPAEPATYWELRTYGEFSTAPTILISAGEKCAAATDPDACRVTFDALEPSMEGFGQNDGPDHYHSHLIVNRGDTTVFLSTRDELVAFLGDVDTPMEAALVTFADGLSVSNARAVAGGHEVLASEITAWCKPVITQRVLVLVSADGKAEELRRQNAHVECNVCI